MALPLLAGCGGGAAGLPTGGRPGGTPPPTGYVAGQSYFGRNQYVEYIAGDLPVIVTAPHGGVIRAPDMPDRAVADTLRDANTQELARAIDSAFVVATGRHPHVVMCRVHRVKLDCNRELAVAAMGDPEAAQAWNEFHAFIAAARGAIVREHGSGLLIDLHGHGHTLQRLELGYLLSGPDPAPSGTPFFNGGYNMVTHGSRAGGSVSAVQLEANFSNVRDTPGARAAFAGAFVGAVRSFLGTWLGLGT